MPKNNLNTVTLPVRVDGNEFEDTDDQIEEADDDNMFELINILQQFKKQKSVKASSRNIAFQQQKKSLINIACRRADDMTREGVAYIEQCKAGIKDFQQQETKSDAIMKNALQLWTANETSFRALLNLYPFLIDDLSHRRSNDVNMASEMLETHPNARNISRRKLVKAARKQLEVAIENQKVLTDATGLIRHYKALLLS